MQRPNVQRSTGAAWLVRALLVMLATTLLAALVILLTSILGGTALPTDSVLFLLGLAACLGFAGYVSIHLPWLH